MVHTEFSFSHEAVPQHTEQHQVFCSIQNESVSTTEHNSIAEHDLLLVEISWFDRQVQTTIFISMPHDITIVKTNVSKSSETKNSPSEQVVVPTFTSQRRTEQYDIDFE